MTKKLLMLCAAAAIAVASCTKPSPLTTNTGNSQNGEKTGNKTQPDTTKPPYNIEEGCGDTAPVDCDSVFCTLEFRQIFLEVKNTGGATVTLTSFHTEDMAGNKLPTHLYEYDSWRDAYMVFNDAWVRGNENTTKQVRFVGYVGSTKVVDEVYTIATDCCHIDKTAGKDKVVLP